MKKILIATGVIMVFIGGVYVLNSYISDEQNMNNIEDTTGTVDGAVWEQYENQELGLFFQYPTGPDGYVLLPHATNTLDVTSLANLTLVDRSEYEELLSTDVPREGPPAISFQIFSNPAELTLLQWIQANPTFSNIELALTTIEESEFKGLPAVRYTTDGLYQNDIVVVNNEGKIYLFTGSYDDPESVRRQDFLEILESVSFSK